MNIELNMKRFRICSVNIPQESFEGSLCAYLDDYQAFLRENSVDQDIINSVEKFSRNIYMCLLEYRCGQRTSARDLFESAIQHMDLSQLNTKMNEETLFRARNASIPVHTKDEMFHKLFEDRYYISEQRYSYAGEACLYLGTSAKVCCIEKNLKDDHTNIAVFKTKSNSIGVLDLYFFQNYNFENLIGEELRKFLIYWPLVACCSFNCKSKTVMSLRPDHIIPLLLREYLFDKNFDTELLGTDNQIYGIRYRSVHRINTWTKDKTNDYVNFVFPVIHDNRNGHCDVLESLFTIDKVCYLKDL